MTKLKTATRAIDNRRLLGLVIARIFIPRLRIHLPAEGYGEIAAAILIAGDRELTGVSAQPESVKVRIDGRQRRYTPDYRLDYASAPSRLWELHSEGRLNNEATGRKLDVVEIHYAREGKVFERFASGPLIRALRTRNQRILNRYALHPTSDRERELVNQVLDSVTSISIKSLAQALNETSVTKSTLYRLLYEGFLKGDLHKHKVGNDFLVSRGQP